MELVLLALVSLVLGLGFGCYIGEVIKTIKENK